MTEYDNVNRPAHYTAGRIEAIEAIREALGDGDPFVAYCRGNAMKYLWRAGKKDPAKAAEDLRKAAWYATRAADHLGMGQ